MGRHTVPGTGTPEPDRGFWVRFAVAAVVVVLVGGWFALRTTDDGGEVGTAEPSDRPSPTGSVSSSAPPSSSPSSPAPSSSPSPSATTPSATRTKRPSTLAFTVRYPAYITVRVPGGRTLVSKVFTSGAKASFNEKVLQVVNGRPQAVRFVVNGKVRKQGPPDQTEIFTVRRQ